MWTTILSAVLPLALNLIGRWIAHQDKESEAVKAYYAFIEAMGKQPAKSARLRRSLEGQRARLEKQLGS